MEHLEGMDIIIRKLGEKLPFELIGFVLAAGVLIVFIVLAIFLKRYQHPDAPTESVSAPLNDDTTLLGKMRAKAANKPLKPAKIIKEKGKTREVAMAAGFIVDDVERDLPVLEKEKDAAAAGVMERTVCGRYYYPEHVAGNAEWKLLRRPAQTTPAAPLLTEGWQLSLTKGALSVAALGGINQLIADKHWKKHPLEIEVTRNAINFYWDEVGGKDQIENFKTLVEKLNHRSI